LFDDLWTIRASKPALQSRTLQEEFGQDALEFSNVVGGIDLLKVADGLLEKEPPPRDHRAEKQKKIIDVERDMDVGLFHMALGMRVMDSKSFDPAFEKMAVCGCTLNRHSVAADENYSLE
jgi:hypothetical protein